MYNRSELNQVISTFLEDPDPGVCAESIIYLLTKGGEEGENTGTKHLTHLIESSAPKDLRIAAYIIGELEGRYFDDSLKNLLSHSVAEVKIEAIEAAGKIVSDELLPQLIECLAEKNFSRFARKALVQYSLEIVDQLGEACEEAKDNLYLQTQIVKTLDNFRCNQSASVLIGLSIIPGAHLRHQVVRALNRLRREGLDFSGFREDIISRIRSELEDGYNLHLILDLLLGRGNEGFLKEEIEYRINQIKGRIFGLLALIYEQNTINKAFFNYISGQIRLQSSAIELLDTILEKDISRILLPFLDDIPSEEKLRLVKGKIPIESSGKTDWLQVVMRGQDVWLKNVAVWCERDEVKRRFLNEFERRQDMIPVLEKIYFLKGVPLFSHFSGEELRPVAEIFTEVSFEKDATIFSENDPGDSFYIILRGLVKVEGGGKEIAELGDRDFFGEMALLEYAPRTASIKALDDCDLLRLDREDFSDLIDEYPELAKGMLRVLSQRLRSTLEKFEQLP